MHRVPSSRRLLSSRPPAALPALLAGPLLLSSVVLAQHGEGAAYQPTLQPASDAAQAQIAAFEPAEGLAVSLVAAEPLLANPVAFDLAPDGRIYVVETWRINDGVIDMRGHRGWVLEDLACETVEQRIAEIREHFAGKLDDWTRHHERVVCLIDDDGDGVSDRSTVFADGFNTLADGIAAGVLVDGPKVYLTEIPDLWELTDADHDGVAEARRAMHSGYGVHFSLIGHDMHGLRIGPDRRLYFSIGDRGFHVEQAGEVFHHPHEGAVLRCELDGSKLEVLHRGLRNPQELAFDDFGDLFTGDNNSDGGDRARWVHVMDGADSGWRIGFQWLGDRGAWNREQMWKPRQDGQPAYVLPPLANVANGPSGLTCDPGTGVPARWRDRFFLCEFRGSPASSGVLALENKRSGATHELVGTERVIWKLLATDVEIGPDGAFYFLDWVGGWTKTGRGRVYRAALPGLADDALAAETAHHLAEGFTARSLPELEGLLAHPDRRVRQGAQFELVDRAGFEVLARVAAHAKRIEPRVHAVWGLGIGARSTDNPAGERATCLAALRGLLEDASSEVRAQACWMLGDARDTASVSGLRKLLADAEPRVRFRAVEALGRIHDSASVQAIADLLRANAGSDLYLRHAGITALERTATADQLGMLATDADVEVRLAALLAMRERQDPRLADFLADAEPALRTEAARAIHDLRIEAALPALAALSDAPSLGTDEPLVLRVLNAHRLLGRPADADALLRYAADAEHPEAMRREAVEIASEWIAPRAQDRVHGNALELAPRSKLALKGLVARHGAALLAANRGEVGEKVCELLAEFGSPSLLDALAAAVATADRDPKSRAAALRAFGELSRDDAQRAALARSIAADAPRELRQQATAVLAKLDPTAAVPMLVSLVRDAEIADRRAAIRTLGELDTEASRAALDELLDDVAELPAAIHLEIYQSAPSGPARLSAFESSDDPLSGWRMALAGGDARAGERVFRNHVTAACLRCHAYRGQGGEAGPALDGIGKLRDREHLLQALIQPAAFIADGYEQVTIKLADSRTVVGTARGGDAETERLVDAAGKVHEFPRSAIRERTSSGSAMPPMGALLSREELRDVLEFLATRR